jgi:hypothetical protein
MAVTAPGNPNASNLFIKDDVMLALLPPIGFRSQRGSVLAYLKVADRTEIHIQRSELELLNGDGDVVESRVPAFGIKSDTIIKGPYSERFADDSRREESAVCIRWRLNGFEVKASLLEPEGIALRVVYLPLQITKEKDPHIVFTLVNRGNEILNIADGIRNAVCRADGSSYQSNTGGHWDGGYQVPPLYATTHEFNLGDFPGIPRTGRHVMSLRILGQTSEPETIDWKTADRI